MAELGPKSDLGRLVTITYSSFVLFATPIIAPGNKLVSFVFQSDGTESDTLPSGLFTRTLADVWLVVGVGVDVDVGVDVGVDVDEQAATTIIKAAINPMVRQ